MNDSTSLGSMSTVNLCACTSDKMKARAAEWYNARRQRNLLKRHFLEWHEIATKEIGDEANEKQEGPPEGQIRWNATN